MQAPKKYWWVVGVAVPIVVAIITMIPDIRKDGDSKPIYVDVVGAQFTGKVAFNNVTVIAEQALQVLGKDLPDDVVTTLRQALEFAQSKEFDKAIPLLQGAVAAAPVPAVFNNLGAAYLATGNQDKAKEYFKKAVTEAPDEETASFNLTQLPGIDSIRIKEESEEKPTPSTRPALAEVGSGSSNALAPVAGGYSSIKLQTGDVRRVKYTVKINGLPLGIYQFDKNLVIDRFLKQGVQNTISFEFEKANDYGPDLWIDARLPGHKDWFRIYEFTAIKNRLKGSVTIPFAGPEK
ncbi:TPR repeat-containing protein [Nitrosococcus halophilus Nc 4]|uniref:TPR repeat-containing protein n=1 Tax=Nitrosococcus halophilus (strain Nc4) TaxID=472759 RepID=D5C4Y7_NITHN|nr:tetratricopeptide repeat protein [Nitrosococcus halophilus]ADE13410.1 TPR repeat-containing protein [Nitrosococcus halophilus Nc 4]